MSQNYSPDQAERRVNAFFAKIRIVWGNGAYNQQFGTPEDLKFAKLEFYDAILKPSDEDLRVAFDHARKMIGECDPDWRYPHIEKILKAAKRNISSSHKLLLSAPEETPEQKAEKRQVGAAYISILKSVFDEADHGA